MNRSSDLRDAALIYSLRSAPIFTGLPDEELRRIASYAMVRKLKKGEYLFRERDPATGFYVVRSGMINVHRVSADGREHVIHIFRPGESLGEAGLVGVYGYPADARAIKDSEVIHIPKREFMNHQREHVDMAWRMLTSMSQHLRVLIFTLEGLKLKDAETRLLHWILQRCPTAPCSGNCEIPLGMTKAMLANELATRQETLSRIFAKLRDAGLITVKRNSLVVPDSLAIRKQLETNLGGRID